MSGYESYLAGMLVHDPEVIRAPAFERVPVLDKTVATNEILERKQELGIDLQLRDIYRPKHVMSWDLGMRSEFSEDYDKWEEAYRIALREVADNVLRLEKLSPKTELLAALKAEIEKNQHQSGILGALDISYASEEYAEVIHALFEADSPFNGSLVIKTMDALHLANIERRQKNADIFQRYRGKRVSKKLRVEVDRLAAVKQHSSQAFDAWIST